MKQVLFMGCKEVGARSLDYIAGLDDVEIAGVLPDARASCEGIIAIAEECGIDVLDYDEALQRIDDGSLYFDLGVSVLYSRKLRDGFLTMPPLGVINFHPAPLPEYKGTAGYNLAILESLSEWAVSAHYMDQKIDTGDIIRVQTFSIDSATETAMTLERLTQPRLLELVRAVVVDALGADSRLPAYENVGGRYVSQREMEEMKEIREGDDVPRKIRAFWFPPYDGAYIVLDGAKYTLIDCAILAEIAGSAPG